MDLQIFNYINQYASRWVWLDSLGIFLAEYLGYGLILFIIILVIINYKKYLRMAIESALAGVLARLGIVSLIRHFWERTRPYVDNNVNLLFEHNELSFPSGHAAFFFAVSLVVFYYNKKIGVIFFLASILIVVARVFSGIHWPSDILAGAIVGIFSGWLIHCLLTKK